MTKNKTIVVQRSVRSMQNEYLTQTQKREIKNQNNAGVDDNSFIILLCFSNYSIEYYMNRVGAGRRVAQNSETMTTGISEMMIIVIIIIFLPFVICIWCER